MSAPSLKQDSGFTLIEIMVGMILMTMGLYFVVGNPFNSRDSLDKALTDIERGVRFSVDEAALRNTLVRLHFYFDNDPQEYTVEYGPDDSFILPSSPFQYSGDLSEKEQEEREAENKELNQKFNKVREFQEENKQLPVGVRIIGVGGTLYEDMVIDYEASFYVYPTGEKDNAIIILGTDEELATLKVDAFNNRIETDYYPLEFNDTDELEDIQLNLAQEIFEKWKKEN